jgi:uncharacterized protein YdcH (DUF465 family)
MSITTTHDVRQSLMAQDSEFKRLSEQHSLCELELEQITNSVYLSAEDLVQEANLKKIKLHLKDEMERIVARYQHAAIQH